MAIKMAGTQPLPLMLQAAEFGQHYGPNEAIGNDTNDINFLPFPLLLFAAFLSATVHLSLIIYIHKE